MSTVLIPHMGGGYQFLPGITPFSSGVVALPGFEIVRVTLRSAVPYRQGFDLIAAHLAGQGRPLAALCGVELRSPHPLPFQAFADFNREYEQVLSEQGLLLQGQSPIARTKVVPALHPPDETTLYAFSYTTPERKTETPATFVIAGAGELRSRELAWESIVRSGDTSPDAMGEKAAQVRYVIRTRMTRLQVTWSSVTALTVYTVHPFAPMLVAQLFRDADQTDIHGWHWCYSQPPIVGVEFEMDMRGIQQERWLA